MIDLVPVWMLVSCSVTLHKAHRYSLLCCRCSGETNYIVTFNNNSYLCIVVVREEMLVIYQGQQLITLFCCLDCYVWNNYYKITWINISSGYVTNQPCIPFWMSTIVQLQRIKRLLSINDDCIIVARGKKLLIRFLG